jgi:predicted PurR-regulated permease PerM
MGVMSQFVPTIGTYLGAVLPLLIALIDEPLNALWVLAFAVLYQQIENYLLAPRITARTMELHPAVAFGSVIAGAGILGPVGALLALPAAAVFQAVGSTYVSRHEVVDSKMTRTARASRQRRGVRRQPLGDG